MKIKSVFLSALMLVFSIPQIALAGGQGYVDGPLTVTGPLKIQNAVIPNTKVLAAADFPYTVLTSQSLLKVNATGSARTINLYECNAANNKRVIEVIGSSDAASNNITIDPYSSQTIGGSSTKVINKNYGSVKFQCYFSTTGSWDLLSDDSSNALTGTTSTNTWSGNNTFFN